MDYSLNSQIETFTWI